MSEACGYDGCERAAGHAGTHARMITPEELFDLGLTENQVQEWANEAERGYDPAKFRPLTPERFIHELAGQLKRREYNEAERASLDSAVEEFMQAAVRFGCADEAARHGG